MSASLKSTLDELEILKLDTIKDIRISAKLTYFAKKLIVFFKKQEEFIMFHLKCGPLSQYRIGFLTSLAEYDEESQYTFSIDVQYAYENPKFHYLTGDDLRYALNKDLSSLESKLKVTKIISLTSPSSWPMVSVESATPMTLTEFCSIIGKIFYDEQNISYFLRMAIDDISVLSY